MLCTNAYSPQIDPYFVAKSCRRGRNVWSPNRSITCRCPFAVTAITGYMYYRSTFDGRFLLGGGRQHYRDEKGDTTEDRLNPNVQAFLDDYLEKYFPM